MGDSLLGINVRQRPSFDQCTLNGSSTKCRRKSITTLISFISVFVVLSLIIDNCYYASALRLDSTADLNTGGIRRRHYEVGMPSYQHRHISYSSHHRKADHGKKRRRKVKKSSRRPDTPEKDFRNLLTQRTGLRNKSGYESKNAHLESVTGVGWGGFYGYPARFGGYPITGKFPSLKPGYGEFALASYGFGYYSPYYTGFINQGYGNTAGYRPLTTTGGAYGGLINGAAPLYGRRTDSGAGLEQQTFARQEQRRARTSNSVAPVQPFAMV